MRIPLGLNIYDEDFSFEKNAIIVGAYEEEVLIGVGTMSYSDNTFKLEYLCVDTDIQNHGAGGKMLEWLENKALEKNAEKIILDARVSAQKFYENHGYKTVGDVFMLSYAPVPHILMEKIL
jgi:predicted GNAT family N-acyltransferase